MKKSTITVISAIIGVILAISIIGGVVIYLHVFKPQIWSWSESEAEINFDNAYFMSYVNPETGETTIFAKDNNGNFYYEGTTYDGKAIKYISINGIEEDFIFDTKKGEWKVDTNDFQVPSSTYNFNNRAASFETLLSHNDKLKKIKKLSCLNEISNEIVMDKISDYDYELYRITPKGESKYSTAECAIDKETNRTLFFKVEYTNNDGSISTTCFVVDEFKAENDANYRQLVSHLIKD